MSGYFFVLILSVLLLFVAEVLHGWPLSKKVWMEGILWPQEIASH